MPPNRSWSVFLDWLSVKNLHRFLPRFLFQGQEPSPVLFFLVLFKSPKNFLWSISRSISEGQKVAQRFHFQSIFLDLTHLFLLFLFFFSCFYKNPISVLKTLFRSIFWSILGVRTLPRSFPQSISGVGTLPRFFVGSSSECPNIHHTIPSSVYTAYL